MPRHPAPWAPSPAGYGATWIRDANGRGICTVPPVSRESRNRDADLVERQADITLLAALPDLVEALRFLREGLEECSGYWTEGAANAAQHADALLARLDGVA
jgi:hypothetical protein